MRCSVAAGCGVADSPYSDEIKVARSLTQVGGADTRVVQQHVGLVGERDAAGFEHVAAVGHLRAPCGRSVRPAGPTCLACSVP